MFIFKYALKSISRSLGRNILIGIIVFIIATAACVAMSIQKAAETAAANTLKLMNISAQLNVDRDYIYKAAKKNTGSEEMSVLMPEMTTLMKKYALDLDGMNDYAEIKNSETGEKMVKTFYYQASISINGSDIEKYDLNASTQETTEATQPTTVEVQKMTDPAGNEVETPTMPVVEPQEPQQMEKSGDFELLGYSSYDAMKKTGGFKDGDNDEDESKTREITKGSIFADNTKDYVCMVNEDLLNVDENKDKDVGDTITLVNPKNEDETYELEIVAIYTDSSTSTSSGGDPANCIITSYEVVKDIESKSEETNAAAASTDSETGSDTDDSDSEDNENVLTSQFEGTFIFATVADYEQFKQEVKAKAKENGEDENLYIVISGDVATFKAGLKPLENLKSFATTFLYLTLAIGAIVLIVISVISIRDRKYEIGALAAMGLKKLKLSMMFMIEVLTITLVAILIGAAVGSAVSVPVTNSLLSAQVEQQQSQGGSMQQGGPGAPGGGPGGGQAMTPPTDGEATGEIVYIDEVGFSVDIFVILKMLAIGIVLSIVSGFTSILFILRYDPKQILASRD